MAIPFRQGVAYAELGTSTGIGPRSAGIIGDLQLTGTNKPRQPDFNSFQWHLNEYPDENIAVIPLGGGSSVRLKILPVDAKLEYTYPSDIVYEYDPDPPLSQPVPNPNGEEGFVTFDTGTLDVFSDVYPRWFTDSPYSFETDGIGVIPPLGFETYFDESMFNLNTLFGGHTSWDVSVDNYESWTMNVATNQVEYYPFKQTKDDLKVKAKVKIVAVEPRICCWNEGVTIKGKLGIKSVSVTGKPIPVPNPEDPSGLYGYAGITLTLGESYDDAGEVDWEVRLEDDFEPQEVEIPQMPGTVTFINDFWITEIVKPS